MYGCMVVWLQAPLPQPNDLDSPLGVTKNGYNLVIVFQNLKTDFVDILPPSPPPPLIDCNCLVFINNMTSKSS